MKKILSIVLAVCVISTLLVMPVSASIFDGYLDLDGSNIIYHQVAATANAVGEVTTISEYPVSNMFDGDPNTTAAISKWGQSYKQGGSTKTELKDIFLTSDLIIDLGDSYEITALEFIAPTAAQATAINAAYSTSAVALNANESWWTDGVRFYTENPITNPSATAASATMVTSKVNNGVTPPAGEYRYIKFSGRYYNQGAGFINELKIKVAAKNDGTIKYADFYQTATDVADTTYPMSNMFDGDPNTHALLSLRTSATGNCNYGMRVVDLGEAKRLSKITMTAPSNYSALLEAVGVTNRNGNYCNIIGYENEPTFTFGKAPSSYPPLTQDPSGVEFYYGQLKNREIEVDTETPIRYLVFYTYMASYPAMLSEIELTEYVEHVHNWATEWSSDDTYHWNECLADGCEVTENSEKEGYGVHAYDDEYDAYCNTCNHFRVVEPAPEPIEATFASEVAFGDADGVETLRFYFTPSFEGEVTNFGAFIVPFSIFKESTYADAEMVTGGKSIESGKTFAADLIDIPAAAYNSTIVAVPFVVSTDSLYTYGARVETTVNALK